MRTYFLLSLSLLASCTSMPAPVAQATDIEPLPGLAGGPQPSTGKYMPAPESISRFLLSLPTRDVLASPALRQRYLQGKVLVQEVPGRGDGRDYLVVDRDESSYGFWIRSFQGVRPDLTGYLIEVQGSCDELRANDPAYAAAVAAAERQCGVTGARYFDSGMRAYRVIEGQPPEDVTASIAPDPAVSSKAMLQQYASMGASGVFAAIENLDRLPVFRWVVEFDPEQPSTSSDPSIFYGGHQAHAGFVVWDGERFERRTTVPRALWPCEPVDQPTECPPRSRDGDPFVTD